MAAGFDACPFCGWKILKGAMRCPGCGKILKSSEEQAESIRRYKESQKSSGLGRVITAIIIIAVLAFAGYRYYDEILALVSDYLPR